MSFQKYISFQFSFQFSGHFFSVESGLEWKLERVRPNFLSYFWGKKCYWITTQKSQKSIKIYIRIWLGRKNSFTFMAGKWKLVYFILLCPSMLLILSIWMVEEFEKGKTRNFLPEMNLIFKTSKFEFLRQILFKAKPNLDTIIDRFLHLMGGEDKNTVMGSDFKQFSIK